MTGRAPGPSRHEPWARGMAALKYRGAYTLCQDEDSCVVFGMPRAALALNAVIEIASPVQLGNRLRRLIVGPGGDPG